MKLIKKVTSGIMLTLLLIAWLTLMLNIRLAKASRSIYIRGDGSIDPADAAILSVDNITYIFVDNIYERIIVERSNIIVDGNGHTLRHSGFLYGSDYGFYLSGMCNVTIQNTNIEDFLCGIVLDRSFFNTISGNTITGKCITAIDLDRSNNNTVFRNVITNNDIGISLSESSFNKISENTIIDNLFGITHGFSSNNNRIYRNIFISNTYQVDSFDSHNVWDDGYPSGGNFWSDYEERYPLVVDEYQGENQNILGNDGIWDSPYVIDMENQDNYPLASPWGDAEPPMADAGADRTVNIGIFVTFDASRSRDDLAIKSYIWTLTDVDLKNLSGVRTVYLFNNAGDFDVTLNVSDYAGNWDTDRIWVHVLPDMIPPGIDIISPKNTTYTSSSVALTFKTSELTSWIGYSLDGQMNVTITGNTTLSELSHGSHSVVVYAKDIGGNIGASEMLHFSIETHKEGAFLVWATIAIIAVAGMTSLVYFVKVKKLKTRI